MLRTVQFNLVIYLTLGLPIAVLPVVVRDRLGLGTVLAGLAISLQYLGTLLSRPSAGRIVDTVGPRRGVLLGLAGAAASGALLALAGIAHAVPLLAFAAIAASRVVAGCAESWGSTGSIMWTIGRLGARRTAHVISWNGITSYGGLAVGAPVGLAVVAHGGLAALGLLIVALAGSALLALGPYPDVAVRPGKRLAFAAVFGRVTPFGIALSLGSVGFGAVAAFGALLFGVRHWGNPALALSAFGGALMLSRFTLAGRIGAWGGLPVAIGSLAVEAAGLALLAGAGSATVALAGAALAGGGFALVFPALGIVAVGRVDPSNRGAALGAYALFSDIALGVSGPLAGVIASGLGFSAVFAFAAAAAGLATLLALLLRRSAT